jgi:TatD DNase family protein
MFFDSHCHLTDERFAGDIGPVLDRARAAGVTGVVTIASNIADARAAVALANSQAGVWCSAGVHPHEAATAQASLGGELRELAAEERVVAIGETGLDYHYDNSPRDVQRRVFGEQLVLGVELGLPVIVHCRSADDDAAAMIREHGASLKGVLHCFASGAELLDEGLAAGWYVSFAGLVSFRNYTDAELVRRVPIERLLIETDSPYLAPVPQRGKRNEPAFVAHVAEAVARIRELPVDEIAAATTANARAFYGIGSRT